MHRNQEVKNRNICILFPEDYLGVYPSLINGITQLSDWGNTVKIMWADKNCDFPSPPDFPENVDFEKIKLDTSFDRNEFSDCSQDQLNSTKIRKGRIKEKLGQIIPQNWKDYVRRMRGVLITNLENSTAQISELRNLIKYILFTYKNFREKKYCYIIAVDSVGLSTALICNFILKRKVGIIYWSLELEPSNQSLWFKCMIKKLESFAQQMSDFIIIQEEQRAKALCSSNKLKFIEDNFVYVPHGMIGQTKLRKKSQFLRNKFKLQNEDIVILHAGWINDAMSSLDLAKSTRSWEKNWKLIFHERENRSENENYIQKISKLGFKNVLLSLKPVKFEKVDEVINSSDVGVVIYNKQMGDNCELITRASGKMAHYLRCGIPVVCLSLPGYRKIIDEYQCGVTFDSINQIHNAIRKILNNYDFYKKNTKRCYMELYEFSIHFKKVTVRIDKLLKYNNKNLFNFL